MREEYGWRAKIGMLSPMSNFITFTEWSRVLPDGVTLHEARMGLTEATPEHLKNMRKSAVGEARKLALGSMDILFYGCTSGSFVGGPGYDEDIIKELEAAVGIPTTTTTTCVLQAFADLGIKKIALVGPYLPELFDNEVEFFKGHNIETLYVKALGKKFTAEISLLRDTPYVFYRHAKEAFRSARGIDAVFITCMASPAMKIIPALEDDTGLPVLSSNSASLYGVLKKLGIKVPIEGYGRVFKLL